MSAEGLRLALRVTPNAGRDALDGVEIRDDGSAVLRLRIRAVPDKGKANAAAIALLARTLGRPKTSFRLVAGATSRSKLVLITGDAVSLAAALDALVGD